MNVDYTTGYCEAKHQINCYGWDDAALFYESIQEVDPEDRMFSEAYIEGFVAGLDEAA